MTPVTTLPPESTDRPPTTPRRTPRAAVRSLAAAVGAAALLLPGAAYAEPPSTWEDTQREAPLTDLIYLIGVPLLVVAVITLLVYLPSMVRKQSAGEGGAFEESPEWFGGPRAGAQAAVGATAADAAGADGSKGGAGARW